MHQAIIQALTQKDKPKDIYQNIFFAQNELARNALNIHIEGLGDLPLTIDADVIHRLKALATEAKYGLREKTLLDKTVRDTLEITADRLSVSDPAHALEGLLKRMQIQLGLPQRTELSAHLHNLLIYGPGQFFDKHRDSEKLPGMVATLIIVLPCAHIGGDLHIEQGQSEFVFSSENLDNDDCQCIMFYADCKHHITPVRQGHRIALSYNVVMNSEVIELESEDRNQALETAFIHYFGESDISDPSEGSVHKLVYVLEHSYTEHSLRWNLLKGIDQQNANTLRHAAQRVGLIPHLALLEWHDMWTAYEENQLEELLESNITLHGWIDQNNQSLPYSICRLNEDEVCSVVDIRDLEPDESDYEGHMGNYGCTQDYWYRRAAIVLWHKNNTVVADFELNFDATLAKLVRLTEKPGQEQEVKQMIQALSQHLVGSTDVYLDSLFTLALYVKDPETARLVLAHGALTHIGVKTVGLLVQLQKLYGVDWCLGLLHAWKENVLSYRHLNATMDRLPIQDLIEAQADARLSAFFLQYYGGLFLKQNEQLRLNPPLTANSSLNFRLQQLTQLLHACSALADMSTAHALLESVLAAPNAYPLEEMGDLVLDKFIRHMDDVQALKKKMMEAISKELQRGLQGPADWTVYKNLPSHCADCSVVNQFLSDAAATQKIWPLAADRRNHVERLLDDYLIPVNCEVKKQGSPYKLIMTKNPRLHSLARDRFHQLQNLAHQLKDGCPIKTNEQEHGAASL